MASLFHDSFDAPPRSRFIPSVGGFGPLLGATRGRAATLHLARVGPLRALRPNRVWTPLQIGRRGWRWGGVRLVRE